MKKLKRIKWENITAIAMVMLDMYCMYTHIRLNGFYSELVLELIVNTMSVFGVRYIVKDVRTNPSNWLFD